MLPSQYRRLVVVSHGEHLNALLLTIHLQLFDCSRSINITCYKKWFLAFFLNLPASFAAVCGCLTCSLKTCHHDDRDLSMPGKSLISVVSDPISCNHLFINDLDDHLSRIQTLHHILSNSSLLNTI